MKKLPLDVSDFSTMITGDYVYIDKTKYLYDLINKARFYFLSRPRRFGKSLLISTLQEMLSGNKTLFKDLWLGKSDYNWQKFPIVHLDLSIIGSNSPDDFRKSIIRRLNEIAQEHGIAIEKTEIIEDIMRPLIKELSERKGKIVLLVDEYDYPLLKHIHDAERAKNMLEVLKSLFSVVKGMSGEFRMIFITGVTKFSKASIFSGLNNLVDITMDPNYAQLLGYTETEIEQYLSSYLHKIEKEHDSSHESLITNIQTWYNGYQFSIDNLKVYNPFSVLYFLNSGRFSNYWFETGTPSFLINLVKKYDYPIQDFECAQLNELEMTSFDVDSIPIIPIFFQTGYLTVKAYDPDTKNYTLDYPNKEVKLSFLTHFLKYTASVSIPLLTSSIFKLTQALKNNTIDEFCKVLQHFFAGIPYDLHIPLEKYYQSIFYVVMHLLGACILTELKTNIGRIDALIQTQSHIYIFEFKLDGTGEQALQQIENKKYYERYLGLNKTIVLVGISFDSQARNISSDWASKTIR